jgi:hypothetical protein
MNASTIRFNNRYSDVFKAVFKIFYDEIGADFT